MKIDSILGDAGILQLNRFKAISELFPAKHTSFHLVETHNSSGHKLPVVQITFHPYNQVYTHCFIRDNFYDIKLSVVSDGPVKIPYNVVFTKWSDTQYKETKEKAMNYVGKNNPDYCWENDDWYEKYAGKKILRHFDEIWVGTKPNKCYCEGINKLDLPEETFQIYKKDKKVFTLSLSSNGHLAYVLDFIYNSLESYRSKYLYEKK